jgi:phosphatidylinositol 3-kinase
MEKQKRKDVPTIDWLDKLVYRQIERIYTVRAVEMYKSTSTDFSCLQEESARSDKLYLYVDLPRFDLPVLFGETEYPPPALPALVTSSKPAGAPPTSAATPTAPLLRLSDPSTFLVIDPDIARDNPVEAKHLRLVRSHRSGPLDREMKPNAITRDELNVSDLLCDRNRYSVTEVSPPVSTSLSTHLHSLCQVGNATCCGASDST